MSCQGLQHFSETNSVVTSFAGHPAVIVSALLDETLLEQFDNHFDAMLANTIERVRTAQRVRHQVYCIEHPHEQSMILTAWNATSSTYTPRIAS
jgi:hypothetical protein